MNAKVLKHFESSPIRRAYELIRVSDSFAMAAARLLLFPALIINEYRCQAARWQSYCRRIQRMLDSQNK